MPPLAFTGSPTPAAASTLPPRDSAPTLSPPDAPLLALPPPAAPTLLTLPRPAAVLILFWKRSFNFWYFSGSNSIAFEDFFDIFVNCFPRISPLLFPTNGEDDGILFPDRAFENSTRPPKSLTLITVAKRSGNEMEMPADVVTAVRDCRSLVFPDSSRRSSPIVQIKDSAAARRFKHDGPSTLEGQSHSLNLSQHFVLQNEWQIIPNHFLSQSVITGSTPCKEEA